MRNLLTVIYLLAALELGAVQLQFPLGNFQSDSLIGRSVLVTPLSLTNTPGSIPAMDPIMYVTTNTGYFWISNMVSGTYQFEIQAPPRKTVFKLFIPVGTTNVIADSRLMTTTNSVDAQSFAYTIAAVDALLAGIGATTGVVQGTNVITTTNGGAITVNAVVSHAEVSNATNKLNTDLGARIIATNAAIQTAINNSTNALLRTNGVAASAYKAEVQSVTAVSLVGVDGQYNFTVSGMGDPGLVAAQPTSAVLSNLASGLTSSGASLTNLNTGLTPFRMPTRLVMFGASTVGNGSPPGANPATQPATWPYYLTNGYLNMTNVSGVVVCATSGGTQATLTNIWWSTIVANAPTGGTGGTNAVFVYQPTVNDVVNGTISFPIVSNDWSALRTLGYTVLAMTIPDIPFTRTNTAVTPSNLAADRARQSFNALVRLATNYTRLVDADTLLTDYLSTTFDGSHYTTNTQRAVAKEVARVLDASGSIAAISVNGVAAVNANGGLDLLGPVSASSFTGLGTNASASDGLFLTKTGDKAKWDTATGSGLVTAGTNIVVSGSTVSLVAQPTFDGVNVTNVAALTAATATNLASGSFATNTALLNPSIPEPLASASSGTFLGRNGDGVVKVWSGLTWSQTQGYIGNGAGLTNINTNGLVQTSRAVNTTSPLLGGGILDHDLSLTILTANGSQIGALSAADWNIFNRKWDTNGNSAGASGFLGTTNMSNLRFKANGAVVMEYRTNGTVLAGPQTNDSFGVQSVILSPFGGNTNASATNSSILGGVQNSISNSLLAIVVGGRSNRIAPSGLFSYVGAFIGGGEQNSIGTEAGFIGGGFGNTIGPYGTGSTIVGGFNHSVGVTNLADAAFASFIGGGYGNFAEGQGSTVAGGYQNAAVYEDSFVGGGIGNTARGFGAAVVGGQNNISTGGDNFAMSSIAGGYFNAASAMGSAIGGGSNNIASGIASVVPGGGSNIASGTYSFAAGRNARAGHSGAFVWADSSNTVYSSGAVDTFNVRAQGGVHVKGDLELSRSNIFYGDATGLTNFPTLVQTQDTRALTFSSSANQFTGTFTGNGAGLTNLNTVVQSIGQSNWVWMATTGKEKINEDWFADNWSPTGVRLWSSSDGTNWVISSNPITYNPSSYTNGFTGPANSDWSILYDRGQWWSATVPGAIFGVGNSAQGVELSRSYDLVNWTREKVFYPFGQTNSLYVLYGANWFRDTNDSIYLILSRSTNGSVATGGQIIAMPVLDATLTNWGTASLIKRSDVSQEGIVVRGTNGVYQLYYRCIWPGLEWLRATNSNLTSLFQFSDASTNLGWGTFGSAGNSGSGSIIKVSGTHWRAYMKDEVATGPTNMYYLDSLDDLVTWSASWMPLASVSNAFGIGLALAPNPSTNTVFRIGDTNQGIAKVLPPLLLANSVRASDGTFVNGLVADSVFSPGNITTGKRLQASSVVVRASVGETNTVNIESALFMVLASNFGVDDVGNVSAVSISADGSALTGLSASALASGTVPQARLPYSVLTNFTSYAVGTAYTLTGTSAQLDFGTTDPIATINQAGTYLIFANVGVKYSGATYANAQTVTLKLRRTNNTAADVSNGSRTVEMPFLVAGAAFTGGDVMTLPTVIYTTANANDTIGIFGGLSATPPAGSVQTDSAEIVAIRIY